MAAVERDVPPRCGVTDGEIEALVLHFTDIHNRWAGDTSCCGRPGVEQQVVGAASVNVKHDVEHAVEKHSVRADVAGAVLLPLQIGITLRRLAEAGNDALVRSGNVVEGIATIAAVS